MSYGEIDSRPHRSIMLDLPPQRDSDGWGPVEPSSESAPERASTDPHPLEVLDVAQLDRLVVDVGRQPPELIIGDLLAWPNEVRQNLFRIVGDMQSPYTVRRGLDGQIYADIFELVVALMEGDEDVNRCESGRRAAIEAVAYFHREQVIPSANRIVRRLRELGVQGVGVGEVQREIQSFINSLPDRLSQNQQPVLDVLPDAPVTAGCVIPAGWQLSTVGISRWAAGPIICVPIVIVGRQHAIHGRSETMQLSYYEDGRWHGCLATRQQIASAQKIQTLAAGGLPVDATNARELVQYLHDFRRDNAGHIPMARASHALGWQDHGELDVFVLPTQVLTRNETLHVRPVSSRRPDDFTTDTVVFIPLNAVAAEIADGVHSRGDYEGWLSAIAAIGPFPRIRFALYASLSVPLLRILDVPNFVVDFGGPTSGGKTTTLAVVASPWGNPDEDSMESYLQSWESTPAFRELALSTLNSVPLLLDETRIANSESEVVQTIYRVAKGRNRGRGQRGLSGRLGGSSTILFSTGEVPITAMTQQGGVRARVVPIWGSPFGGTSPENNRTIQSLMAGIKENFGFAGPQVVRNLLDHRVQWDWLRQDYCRRRGELVDRAGNRGAVCRLAAPLATVSMAAWLAHESLHLPWPLEDPVDLLWAEIIGEARDADRAEAALEHALGWAASHQNSFFGRGNRRGSQPLGGWAGRWDEDGEWLGFAPERLRTVLHTGGFDFEASLRMWNDRGWILTDRHSGKLRHRARIANENVWLVAIRRDAIALAHGETDTAARGTVAQEGEQIGGTT